MDSVGKKWDGGGYIYPIMVWDPYEFQGFYRAVLGGIHYYIYCFRYHLVIENINPIFVDLSRDLETYQLQDCGTPDPGRKTARSIDNLM